MAKELRIPTHHAPATPGEMLVSEFLAPSGMTITAFAEHIGMRRDRVSELVNGHRRVTPDTALRFGRACGTSAQFWLNTQQITDLYAAQHAVVEAEILKIRPPWGAA